MASNICVRKIIINSFFCPRDEYARREPCIIFPTPWNNEAFWNVPLSTLSEEKERKRAKVRPFAKSLSDSRVRSASPDRLSQSTRDLDRNKSPMYPRPKRHHSRGDKAADSNKDKTDTGHITRVMGEKLAAYNNNYGPYAQRAATGVSTGSEAARAAEEERMAELFQKFCSSSTIHGTYFWTESKSRLAKLAWGLIVFLGIISATFIINSSFKGWKDNPVITSVAQKSIEEISFPAITICPMDDTR